MQTYEFYTTPKNGIIKIPEQYKDKIKSSVKVIVHENIYPNPDNASGLFKRTDLLSPISIDTKGWTFDKEEANERE